MSISGSLSARNGPRWSVTEILLAVTLLTTLVLGGTVSVPGWRMNLIFIASSALAGWAANHGAVNAFRALPRLTRLALLLVPLLLAAQLVPLPPALWEMLPGRAVPARIFDLLGTRAAFHPLSLVPRQTLFQLAALLPPAAVFLAALTLDEKGRERCVALFLALTAISILIGLVQMSSRGTTFNFHDSDHRRHLVGFFINRNHQGLMIAMAGVFGVAMIHRHLRTTRAGLGASLVVSLALVTAAVGTISRAGLLLTVLGLLAGNLVLFAQGWDRRRFARLGAALVALAGLGYAVSFNPVVEKTLARFDDMAESGRWEFLQRSLPLVDQYFPWGSGIGSFVEAYFAVERLDDVTDKYLNHVHNDYVELLIEAGLPGMAVLGLFVWVFACRARALLPAEWKRSAHSLPAGISIVMVALHSFVDYPMRMPAIAVLFALALAFFLTGPRPERGAGGRRRPAEGPEGR